MRKLKVVGGGKCPKCDRDMQRYEHMRDWKPPTQRGHYRFWDVCHPCGHIQHYAHAFVPRAEVLARLDAIKRQLGSD